MDMINLALFDGEGGVAAGEAPQGEANQVPGNTRRGKTGEKVLYGKQEMPEASTENSSDAGSDKDVVKPTSNTLEDKRKAFRALVEGEYKDMYTEDTQRIIDRRFKETKELEKRLSNAQPVLDILMQRYKIADGDMGKLMQAVENDNAYWDEAAEEAGMTVDQYKTMQRLQRENDALNRAMRENKSRQAAESQLQRWYTEGEGVKVVYPDFDLQKEASNPQFLSLLKAGIPVQHAYEVVHMDDIKAGIVQAASQRVEKKIVDNIRAKGSRPQENGTSAQSGFTIKEDPSKWTKADRAEIARRVARGETIKL